MVRTGEALERRRRALRAATRAARRYGIEPEDPRILKDSNNTIVHLAPAPIVAKVCTTTIQREDPEVMDRELAIARYLAGHAPIAVPSDMLPATVHRGDGMAVTFWRFYANDPGAHAPDDHVAAALQAFHSAFESYPGDLPAFRNAFGELRFRLEEERWTPALRPVDRRFLLDEHERMWQQLLARRFWDRPLHGDPHEGNRLITREGVLFVDFEASCRGPLEWDLSSVSDDAARSFPGVDQQLLPLMRDARSLSVAVFCWMQPERAPEVAEAARFHLARLQRRARR